MNILVVEDDYYIAMDIAAVVRNAGAAVLGPCPDAVEALKLVPHAHMATLDVHLRDETSEQVANALAQSTIPFGFITGHPAAIPEMHRHRAVCQKPASAQQILAMLHSMRTADV